MLSILEILLDLLLVLGTSVWGWFGIALGLVAAFITWEVFSASAARGAASAVAFIVVFALCAWQGLRRQKGR